MPEARGCEREDSRSSSGGATKKRRDEEATGRREVERTGAETKGGGKVGRPGIDRLKKGWIFLPLGGGPAV